MDIKKILKYGYKMIFILGIICVYLMGWMHGSLMTILDFGYVKEVCETYNSSYYVTLSNTNKSYCHVFLEDGHMNSTGSFRVGNTKTIFHKDGELIPIVSDVSSLIYFGKTLNRRIYD